MVKYVIEMEKKEINKECEREREKKKKKRKRSKIVVRK